jgi:predicted nucleotidyltransferase
VYNLKEGVSLVNSFAEAAALVKNTISSKYPQISRAFIFGSYAEGVQTPDSDLDVLVELRSPMGLQFISFAQELESAVGKAVDVITAKQAESLERNFGYDIVRKARLVYERTED